MDKLVPGPPKASPSIVGAERILVGDENAARRNKALREFEEWMHATPTLAIDTETTGLKMWRGDRVAGISVYGPDRSYYLPFRHGHGELLNLRTGNGRNERRGADLIRDIFGEVWADSSRVWRMFNAPFDMKSLYQDLGRLPAGRIEDASISAHLLNENEPSLALKPLSDKYLDAGASDDEKLLEEYIAALGIKGKGMMWHLNPAEVYNYACGDVELTWALIEFQLPFLEKHGLLDLWYEINDYSYMITEMETHGALIDLSINRERSAHAHQRYEEELAKLVAATGGAISNPNSPPQCAKYLGLFDAHTGNPSASKSAIEARIALGNWDKEAEAKLLLDVRQWDKANNLYYEKYPDLMEPAPVSPHEERHILHCNFRITGTISGRLSCTEPNLQAVPRQSDIYLVKDVFVPRPGYALVEFDYAQAELRMLAHEANIPGMAEILNNGGDLHGATAEEMTKIRGKKVDRDTAKRLNFGVVYGLGAPGLSLQIFVTEAIAAEFLAAYHGLWPQVKEFARFLEQMARRDGTLDLWTGRKRHYTGGCDCGKRGCRGWHKAMSNKIQGGVGEIIRIAMVDVWNEFYDRGVRPLIQVHDSLLTEIPLSAGPGLVAEIKERMERGPNDLFREVFHRCPPVVDAKWSAESWGKAKPQDKEAWVYGDYATELNKWYLAFEDEPGSFVPDERTKEVNDGFPTPLILPTRSK